MIGNKKFNIIVSIFMVIAICFSSLIVLLPKNETTSASSVSTSSVEQPDYVSTVFNKNEVIDINIKIDESEWQNLLDTAINEEYTSADITVNGTTYNNVAIRAKGNSSLSQVYSDDSTDRYSFKIKFDKYVEGQTLDGLSKLVLNNTMSDATYMKEYLSYDILSFLNVPSPAYAFANITVNDEPWGLYLALEPIEEEFIERYYDTSSGNLYKPESDSVAMAGDNKDTMEMPSMDGNMEIPSNMNGNSEMPSMDGSMEMPNNMNGNSEMPSMDGSMEIPNNMNGNSEMPSMDGNMEMPSNMNGNSEMPSMDGSMEMPNNMNGNSEMPSMDGNMEIPNKGGGGMGMGGNSAGADLVWNGDDIDNYSSIFNNSVFKSTTEEDYEKILDMIEHLDSLEDIENYLDVDETLRYFAANTFLVNLDSYVSSMNHNYYLYENDGLVSILPWDYNLSFAGFQAGSASNAINFPIDNPVTDSLEESPLIGKLLEVDEYKELYHSYLNEIVENYINNGQYESIINNIDSLISTYVENDATAFYTFEEYKNSLSHLINFGYDRATSISEQLNGTQPSTTAGTIETTVDLTAMGQQGGGDKGGMKSPDGNFEDNNSMIPSTSDTETTFNYTNTGNNQPQANGNFQNAPNNYTNTNIVNNQIAMSPNSNNTNNNNSSLILSLISIVILTLSIILLSLFKKKKYTSKI